MILDGRKMKFASRKQLNQQKKAKKQFNPVMLAHLSKKQMIGVTPGVKNDLGYSFGLNGIEGKWRARGDSNSRPPA